METAGYILYIVLIILSIVGILSSIVIYSLRATETSVLSDIKKYQARLLAESGIARAEYFLNGGDGHDMNWETDSLIEPVENAGLLKMTCKRFGAYARIVCQGTSRNASCVMTSVVGRNRPDTLSPVITLSGSIRGVVICSPMLLQGAVVLRVDSVYHCDTQGGQPKKKHSPLVTTINRASDSLPFSPATLDTVFQKMQAAMTQTACDSNTLRGNLAISRASDSLISRRKITALGDCELDHVVLIDKTVVVSGTLTLGDSVHCVFCVFIAKNCEIKSGVTDKCLFYSKGKQAVSGGVHDSQFFSEDSIIIGKNARFGDMTLMVSRRNTQRSKSDTVRHGGIYYEEGGSSKGCAICYCDSSAIKGNAGRGSLIVMGNACSFIGYLITDGDIELGSDDIEGHLWAKTVVGRKDANKKINWLYAKSIRPLRRDMPFPLLGGGPIKIRKSLISCEYIIKTHDTK